MMHEIYSLGIGGNISSKNLRGLEHAQCFEMVASLQSPVNCKRPNAHECV
jgi:hypothetical protein